jgi:hypothetical protein
MNKLRKAAEDYIEMRQKLGIQTVSTGRSVARLHFLPGTEGRFVHYDPTGCRVGTT